MSPLGILFALSAGIGADISPDDAAKKDVARLEGKWALISGQRDGTNVPGFMARTAQCIAVGNESTLIMSGRVYLKARYTLDPSQSIKAIDYDVIEGDLRGQKQQGIYEFNGNTVRICMAAPGRERPTDFSAPAGSGRINTAWQKISGPSVDNTDGVEPAKDSGPAPKMASEPARGFRPFGGLFARFANNPGPIRRNLPLFGNLFAR